MLVHWSRVAEKLATVTKTANLIIGKGPEGMRPDECDKEWFELFTKVNQLSKDTNDRLF